MSCGKWMTCCLVGGFVAMFAGGCVSLDDYRRLDAQHRNLLANKEALDQELFDLRNASDLWRSRNDSLDRELSGREELVANLRRENEVLEDMRRILQKELENVAGKANMAPIHIAGPKLPEALDNALRIFADEHPTEVVYDAMAGTVKWKSDLLFALGSDVVKQSSKDALRSFTEIIKSSAAKDFEVIVVGHTDNRPIKRAETKRKHPTNWHLSAHRAISVAGVLREYGYTARRTGIMGYGEYRPIADNGTQAGASQNRRVEVYLVPTGSIVASATGTGMLIDGTRLAFARASR